MNLSEYKDALSIRWKIIKANTRYSFEESIAYVANNWGSLASTFVFMITFLIFVSTLYGNVNTIAGYTYAEMLLFVLIAQLNFYLTWSFSVPNVMKLGQGVKIGELDLFLTKPIPHLWFVTFRKIDLVLLLANAVPSTIPLIILFIKNYNLDISPINIVIGLLLLFMGQIYLHCFQFIILAGSFWTGESRGFETLAYQLGNYNEPIPFEGYPKALKNWGFILLPVILHTAIIASFVLGKISGIFWPFLVFIVTLTALLLKKVSWELALRNYSSASS